MGLNRWFKQSDNTIDLLRNTPSTSMTMLFITHDIALARKVSDRIFVMREGDLVEQGVSSDVIYSPKHPYTKELVCGAEGAAGCNYK